jgi:hypothetical protein
VFTYNRCNCSCDNIQTLEIHTLSLFTHQRSMQFSAVQPAAGMVGIITSLLVFFVWKIYMDKRNRLKLTAPPLPGVMLTRRVAAELGSGARNYRNGARPSSAEGAFQADAARGCE